MWHIFGSARAHQREGYIAGHACQRNGVVYRWVFKDGDYRVAVFTN